MPEFKFDGSWEALDPPHAFTHAQLAGAEGRMPLFGHSDILYHCAQFRAREQADGIRLDLDFAIGVLTIKVFWLQPEGYPQPLYALPGPFAEFWERVKPQAIREAERSLPAPFHHLRVPEGSTGEAPDIVLGEAGMALQVSGTRDPSIGVYFSVRSPDGSESSVLVPRERLAAFKKQIDHYVFACLNSEPRVSVHVDEKKR